MELATQIVAGKWKEILEPLRFVGFPEVTGGVWIVSAASLKFAALSLLQHGRAAWETAIAFAANSSEKINSQNST